MIGKIAGIICFAIFVFFILMQFLNSTFHRMVRREFLALLRERYPGIEIVSETKDILKVRMPDGTEPSYVLERLYQQIVTQAKIRSPEGRMEVYRSFVDSLDEASDVGKLSIEDLRPCILPRLVPGNFADDLPPSFSIPAREVPGIPLLLVWVVDFPNSVAYLEKTRRDELGLNADELYDLALCNLREKSKKNNFRDVIAEQKIVVLKLGDTYEAARLLLIPEQLKPGETILAFVPDRDTLIYMAVPEDGNCKGLGAFGSSESDHALCALPIVVTCAGFETIALK